MSAVNGCEVPKFGDHPPVSYRDICDSPITTLYIFVIFNEKKSIRNERIDVLVKLTNHLISHSKRGEVPVQKTEVLKAEDGSEGNLLFVCQLLISFSMPQVQTTLLHFKNAEYASSKWSLLQNIVVRLARKFSLSIPNWSFTCGMCTNVR